MVPQLTSFELKPGEFMWKGDKSPKDLIEEIEDVQDQIWALGDGCELVIRLANQPPEVYHVEVSEDDILIHVADHNGKLYALQDLSSLMQGGKIPCCSFLEFPRYSWRGMMLDVSRHFQPKEFVLKFIDLLFIHKMNSLHLHLCDDQGWRMEIKRYPRLTEVGAWRKETQIRPGDPETDGIPHGGFYTQDDLREIVAYAAKRGITVMPEIEMPGHCQAALAAYPELGNTGVQLEPSTRFGVIEDVYGVQDETIEFLENVLEEVLEVFPSEFIHVGGDEVPKKQWKESSVAQQRMKDEGLADEDELQSWFIRHFDRWLAARGRRLIGWDEILEGGLAPGAAVMSWRGTEGGSKALEMGHVAIMVPHTHCYFDHYQSSIKATEPIAIGGCTPLRKVYEFDPGGGALMWGSQGQLWSEYMKTPEHVEYMALPRMCALAEVLWGKADGETYETFEERLVPHLEKLKALGYNFRPLQPDPPANYVRIGGWEKNELAGKPSELKLSIPTRVSLESGFSVSVNYGGGFYGVFIDAIEVRSSTGVIRADNKGSSGNIDDNNVVEFPAMAHPVEVVVTLRSKGTGDTVGSVFVVLP
ncbi:MAG: family 20 glycosylhydrolase [Chthonomonas sp.]|nr:family 20 glycosylhydrolase [Chthonomonas sp.]